MIPLKPFQEDAVEAVRTALGEGKRRFVTSVPTGCGKTILALSLCASALRRGNRVLWIAHREELISQTVESFARVADDLAPPGIVKAKRDEPDAPFVIASIQTLWGKDREVEKKRKELKERIAEAELHGSDHFESYETDKEELNALPPPSFPRWEALKPSTFGLVVYDECQHSMSDSVKTIFETLTPKPEQMILGLSATPFRADERSLYGIFHDGIVYQLGLKTAIWTGLLCDFQHQYVPLPEWLDLGDISTSAGDYNASELAPLIEKQEIIDATVEGIQKYASDRKALVFTFTIEQARLTAAGLVKAGLPSAYLSCDTPRAERAELLKKLKRGEIRYLANCAVLTEGFDDPTVDCIAIVRPTRSKPLYQQMTGRGFRLDGERPEKNCLILDFTATDRKNQQAGVNDLIGVVPEPGETSAQAEKRIEEEKIASGRPRDPVAAAMLEAAEKAARERAVFASAWVVLKAPPRGIVEARCVSGSKKRKVVIYTEDAERERWKVIVWLKNGYYKIETHGVELACAESIGRQAMHDMGQRVLAEANAAWRKRPPSAKTLEMAMKCRIALDPSWNGGDASNAINAVTASWNLKDALSGQKQHELFYKDPADFKAALKLERDESERELEQWRENRKTS